MSKGTQIAIATLTVSAALVWFIQAETGGDGTFRYYATVGDYLGSSTESPTSKRGSRIHGFVLEGSIQPDLSAGHVDFKIRDGSRSGALLVRYLGIDTPDLFNDGAEVVVEGRFEEGRFLADRVMAKCPSKYEAEQEPGTSA